MNSVKLRELLKILIISTSSSTGGAAIAAHRLMDALNASGKATAKMLVRDKTAADDNVATVGSPLCSKLKFAFERGVIWLCNRFSKNHLFEVSIANTGYDITKTPEFKQADVIHIHWTQQGMLSLRDMKKIFASGKPVVWTMHDMWACTGVCHFVDNCERYCTHCHDCPMLAAPGQRDLSHRTFEKKLEIFAKHDFTVVTCSDWLHLKTKASALLKGKRIVTLPNPINTDIFAPQPKTDARKALGLPENAKLVLFASQKVTDPRKGINYLVEAAKMLKARGEDLEFVVMGGRSEDVAAMLPYSCHPMGYISSPERAALIYSACDVFVTPSLMDNLPNTIMEAMACGTPCVGFEVGGIPEMIDHLRNGYVARFRSSDDLAAGIAVILDGADYETLCALAREKVLETWSDVKIASDFVDLYSSLK